MPYATPTQQSPVQPSYGRPGHRRSYSHITLPSPPTTSSPPSASFTSASSSMGSLPRRRSTSAGAHAGSGMLASGATPSNTSGSAIGNNADGDIIQRPPVPRKTTFQLGRDDDDSSSGEDDRRRRSTSAATKAKHSRQGDEDDDVLRSLPPLRLKAKPTSSFDQLAVPFPRSSPRSSPRTSPLHSPVGSKDGIANPPHGVYSQPSQPQQHAHTRSTSEQPSPAPNSHVLQTHQHPHHAIVRPIPVSRTYSSPILLSNGKPLRSSLKSSSSSPAMNIPFPSQSILPSVLWPDLHKRVEEISSPASHQRAASAPTTPHLASSTPSYATSPQNRPTESSVSHSIASEGLLSPDAPPSLTSSISSFSSSASTSSSPSTSPPLSPSLPSLSPSLSTSSTLSHTPKNVHFPSQDTDIATVKIFNRSARPASLSLTGRESGNESQTETETEGEGSGSGYGGFGVNRWGGWGSGWGRSGGGGAGGTSGYPFPKVGPVRRSHSPLSNGTFDDDSTNNGTSAKEYYDVDEDRCSYIPMQDGSSVGAEGVAGNGHRVGEGHVYVESVGFVRSVSEDSSSNPSIIKTLPPSRPLTLTGTILVRNLAYRKTVAIRFTMDEWHTTNDVLAVYECSLKGLPERFWATRGNTKVGLPWGLEGDSGIVGTSSGNGEGGRQREVGEKGKEGWDRFRFSISLEDYASLGTLEGRTMWFVARYTAGVDLSAPSATSSFQLMPGIGGSGSSKDHSIPPGQAQEWWDNNASRNYRIGFKKVIRAPETRTRVQGHFGATTPNGRGMYTRGLTFSAPSAYSGSTSSPPPMAGSKSYPAPPQISSSASFPGSGSDSYPFSTPTSVMASPPTPQELQQRKEHQAALTQSTLARLKKLNLRNYAAPATYQKFSPTSVPASTTPVQTPRPSDDHVHVVLPGDDEDHDHHAELDNDRTPTVGHGVLPPTWGDGEKDQFAMGISSAINLREPPVPARNVASSNDMGGFAGGPSPSKLGTSPPFSAMEDMGLGMRIPASRILGGTSTGEHGESYWPWSSFGDVPTTTRGDEGKPGEDEPSVPVDEILKSIKGRSTTSNSGSGAATASAYGSTPGSSSVSGPMVLPHRKRKESNGEHKRTFSIGTRGSSSSSSSSGSGSDSNSKSKSDGNGIIPPGPHRRAMSPVNTNATSTTTPSSKSSGNGNGSGPAMWGLRPGSPRPLVGSGYGSSSSTSSSPSSSSPVIGHRTRFGMGGTRSPMRVSPLASPSISPNGSGVGLASNAGIPLSNANPTQNVVSDASGRTSSPVPGPTSPGSTTDDAVYQAFVRQWCFAQAPGPTVGSSASHSTADSKPDATMRGSGGSERESPGLVA
ncbi:hypothetical protein JR316_0000117 [Psilocybe cubensis]|uniref:Uncharacterized protein n=2 Tax=Psilocybe cubensis TaxID=181762 RepID=A0ACB8HDR0_PSICU|nr:hypothetical protein JR316_0000117 [Psilocybe cubensis]KAH9486053.1 hypothetical protein JR316_0000117 [Psilocybe cubensis]